LPTWAVSISRGSIRVASIAPTVASRIVARKCLPSLVQLRAKSVCAPPRTYTGGVLIVTSCPTRSAIRPDLLSNESPAVIQHPTLVKLAPVGRGLLHNRWNLELVTVEH